MVDGCFCREQLSSQRLSLAESKLAVCELRKPARAEGSAIRREHIIASSYENGSRGLGQSMSWGLATKLVASLPRSFVAPKVSMLGCSARCRLGSWAAESRAGQSFFFSCSLFRSEAREVQRQTARRWKEIMEPQAIP